MSSVRALGAWTVAFASTLVVASVPGSPYRPVPLPGDPSAGPLAPVGAAVGLGRLDADALALVGALVMAATVAAFAWVLVVAWRGGVGARAVVAVAVAAQVSLVAFPLLLSRDVYSYAAYGRIAAVHGANPYLSPPSAFPDDPIVDVVGERWLDTPSVYGPAFTLASAGLADASADPRDLVASFRVLAIVGAVATTLLLAALARRVAPERASFAVAAFGLNPVVLLHGAAGGHNDLLVSAALVGGAVLAVHGRRVPAALALTAGALVKVTAGVALVPLLAATAVRSRRAAVVSVAACAALVGVVAAPYLQADDPTLGLRSLVGTEGWLAPSRFLRRILDAVSGDALGIVVRVAFPLAFAVLLLALARHAWRRRVEGEEELATWAWALLGVALLGPMLLPWYAAWFVPLAFALSGAGRRAAIGTSLALGVSLFATEPAGAPLAYDLNVLLGRWGITPFVIALGALAAREVVMRLRSGGGLEASSDQPSGDGGRR